MIFDKCNRSELFTKFFQCYQTFKEMIILLVWFTETLMENSTINIFFGRWERNQLDFLTWSSVDLWADVWPFRWFVSENLRCVVFQEVNDVPRFACLTTVCLYHGPLVILDSIEPHANMDAVKMTISIELQWQQCSVRMDVWPYLWHEERVNVAKAPHRTVRQRFHYRMSAAFHCRQLLLVEATVVVIQVVANHRIPLDGKRLRWANQTEMFL